MNWLDDQHLTVKDLILQQLLPMAREGLEATGIDRDDIDYYLGVLRDRVEGRRTGARWALESLHEMGDRGTLDQRLRCLVSSMVRQQTSGKPIATWELADFCEELDWRESYQYVSQFMATDLFTVRPDDIVDFAASLMDWRHVRHVPVEDDEGRLVGLVSHRALLRLVAKGKLGGGQEVAVNDIMTTEPVTVTPETATVEAIRLMRESQLACLPVVENGKLVGLVTEHDLIVVNFANGDMVGHTGNFTAAVQAVEALDQCLLAIETAILAANGNALITADHGNCEQMHDPDSEQPHTQHTTEPVPLIYIGNQARRFSASSGVLADIAPTVLDLMAIDAPPAMTGRSLFEA